MSGRDLTTRPGDTEQEPPRWSDGAASGDAAHQGLSALWRRLPPARDLPPVQLAAVRARLPGTAPASRARGVRVWAWALAALLLLLGSGVVAAARGWVPWARRGAGDRPPARPAVAAANVKLPRRVPLVAPPSEVPTPAAADQPPVAMPALDPPLVVTPPVRPRPARALPPAPAAAELPTPVTLRREPPPETEASVLESAVASLRRQQDAAAALRALDRYDARFGSGALVHEAARLRIDALLVLGEQRQALEGLNRLALTGGARDLELLLIRGELRVRLDHCAGAAQDFARVLATVTDPALAVRARAGRAACQAAETRETP